MNATIRYHHNGINNHNVNLNELYKRLFTNCIHYRSRYLISIQLILVLEQCIIIDQFL